MCTPSHPTQTPSPPPHQFPGHQLERNKVSSEIPRNNRTQGQSSVTSISNHEWELSHLDTGGGLKRALLSGSLLTRASDLKEFLCLTLKAVPLPSLSPFWFRSSFLPLSQTAVSGSIFSGRWEPECSALIFSSKILPPGGENSDQSITLLISSCNSIPVYLSRQRGERRMEDSQ